MSPGSRESEREQELDAQFHPWPARAVIEAPVERMSVTVTAPLVGPASAALAMVMV